MRLLLLILVSSLGTIYSVIASPAPTATILVEPTVNTVVPISSNGGAYVPYGCSSPGELVCIADDTYAICDHGHRVALKLATGDKRCVGKAGSVFV